MALYRVIGEGEAGQPSLIEAVGDVVKEQSAPDGVAGALKHAVGCTPSASIFPPARVVQREGTGEEQERDDEKGSSLGRP